MSRSVVTIYCPLVTILDTLGNNIFPSATKVF